MRNLLKILLVEDNSGDADLIKEVLSDGPVAFEIETVCRLSEAINRINSGSFDIILLDLGLPDSSGIETVKSIRKTTETIPIIVQTGNNDAKTGIESIKEGAQDFIIKGETRGEVLSRIITFAIERHHFSSILKESEQVISTLLNSVEVGIIVIEEASRKIKIVNPYACSLLGKSAKEIEGHICHKFICSYEAGKCPILDLGKVMDRSEKELIRDDNSVSTVLKTVTEIFIEGKKHLLEVFVDISDRKKAEENNKRLLLQLEHSEKLESLGVLAGGIAHDFNNLLSGIFGYIELAQEYSKDNRTVLKYLEKSLTVFNRAKDLTQQLLTFSKGGAPVLKTGNISSVLKESSSFVLSGSNVVCEYEIDEDLWLCDFDENQLSQVIGNIVLNAQQAMPLGGKIIICAKNVLIKNEGISKLKEGKFINISISDTGIGIPHEMLNKIFDPFFTTKQKGTGLGLATSYSIIRKHNGFIEAASEQNVGSTFNIYLPSSENKTEKDTTKMRNSHSGNGLFMIMDDEDFMLDVVGEMLTSFGYSVISALNGESAISLCREHAEKGQVVTGAILDLTIPGGMGGMEVIPHIKKIFPDIRLFAASGYSQDPIISNPCEYGFTGSLRKPFRTDELAEILNNFFGG